MSNLTSSAKNAIYGAHASDILSGAIENFAIGSLNGNSNATNTAANNIGAAAINDLGNNIASSTGGTREGGFDSVRYALDSLAFAPKHRFIFKVKFIFNTPYADEMNKEFMYVVKNIDKPTVNFEYDEINMYNFRTQVLRTIRHEPLGMMFHDDIQNKVLDFFNTYRTAYSPVSNWAPDNTELIEESGMDFVDPGDSKYYSASSGLLRGGQKNLLKSIVLYQIYANGSRQNAFHFINPKIDNFDFDNVDYESSDGNSMTVNFRYDSLFIIDSVTNGTPAPAWGASDILGNSENSTNPIVDSTGGNAKAIKPPNSVFGLPLNVASSVLANTASKTLASMIPGSAGQYAGISNAISNQTKNLGSRYISSATNELFRKTGTISVKNKSNG